MISANLWRQLKRGLPVLAAGFDKDDDAEIWHRAVTMSSTKNRPTGAGGSELSRAASRRLFHSPNVPIAVAGDALVPLDESWPVFAFAAYNRSMSHRSPMLWQATA